MSEPAANVSIALEELAGSLSRPVPRAGERLVQNGPLAALEPEVPDPEPNAPGRRQRLVLWQSDFGVLVDEFHASQPGVFTLTIATSQPLAGGGRRYLAQDARGPLAIHPLGDYLTDHKGNTLTLLQTTSHSRFLIAITRDSTAWARIVNGWAIEVRSGGKVYQLLHSNRSHRMRPLGPIQTEARYAGVVTSSNGEWQAVGL